MNYNLFNLINKQSFTDCLRHRLLVIQRTHVLPRLPPSKHRHILHRLGARKGNPNQKRNGVASRKVPRRMAPRLRRKPVQRAAKKALHKLRLQLLLGRVLLVVLGLGTRNAVFARNNHAIVLQPAKLRFASLYRHIRAFNVRFRPLRF